MIFVSVSILFSFHASTALLSGARNVVNIDLSKKIYDHMKILSPEIKDSLISAAILLSNTYSLSGKIDKASDIKSNLSKSNIKRKVGLSWTVVNEEIYVSSDEINEENKNI